MNKRIIATSLALVLALTVVLAVGKTGSTVESDLSATASAVPASAVPIKPVEVAPKIQNDSTAQILTPDIDIPGLKKSQVSIQADIAETQMILDQESLLDPAPAAESSSSLMASLAHLQSALEVLEQLAAETHEAVVNYEKQSAAR